MGSRELLSQLRVRVADTRHTMPAFTIVALDPMATDVELSVSDGRLRTEVENGGPLAAQLSIDLASPNYATLERLVGYLQTTYPRQYQVIPADGMLKDHEAIDLEEVTYIELHKQSVTLRTHRWSDVELLRFIASGAKRHNPSYSVESLPLGEHDMVLQLAHVELLRALATDAARRSGLSGSVTDYLSLADSIEKAYQGDVKRLAKALIPVRTDDDSLRDGDVVIGEFFRASLRTGFSAPSTANIRPQAPRLYDPENGDIFDFSVTIRWRRTSENDVLRMELWRDTTEDVRRTRDVDVYPSTSQLVWSSSNRAQKDQEGVGTEDSAGELICTYHDGFVVPAAGKPFGDTDDSLAPETTYYWRLYIIDRNGEYGASEIVSATTKSERAMLSRDPLIPALSVVTGPRTGGVALTLRGTSMASVQTVLIGGVAATSLVNVDATTVTCVTPSVHAFTKAEQDVVVVSVNGLRDVYPQAWRYA